jgi:CheY-like chemotaxis protein
MANKTILAVDYDSVFRASLVDILNEAGYKAYGAPDASRAISIAGSLGTTDIDLLVLEMAQLDMTGVELIHTIACQQKTIIKVIASSSLFSQADMDIQTSFRSHAGVRKEATSMPAIATKWLLTIGSLLSVDRQVGAHPDHRLDAGAVRAFTRRFGQYGCHTPR